MSAMFARVPYDLTVRFNELVAEWKLASRHMSNSAQMAMLRPYQQIIGLGWPVVPMLLSELRREPDHWFWALEMIAQQNPVGEASLGHIQAMGDAWIEWGVDTGLIER